MWEGGQDRVSVPEVCSIYPRRLRGQARAQATSTQASRSVRGEKNIKEQFEQAFT